MVSLSPTCLQDYTDLPPGASSPVGCLIPLSVPAHTGFSSGAAESIRIGLAKMDRQTRGMQGRLYTLYNSKSQPLSSQAQLSSSEILPPLPYRARKIDTEESMCHGDKREKGLISL